MKKIMIVAMRREDYGRKMLREAGLCICEPPKRPPGVPESFWDGSENHAAEIQRQDDVHDADAPCGRRVTTLRHRYGT